MADRYPGLVPVRTLGLPFALATAPDATDLPTREQLAPRAGKRALLVSSGGVYEQKRLESVVRAIASSPALRESDFLTEKNVKQVARPVVIVHKEARMRLGRPKGSLILGVPRLASVQPVRSEGRLFTMMRRQHLLQMLVVLCTVGAVQAQQPDAAQIAQERRQAELDAPKLVEVLELKPGMTVADVGSGFGAMTVVLGHWIGSGRVFATDITEHALRQTREYVKKEGLTNVTVIEGAEAATNLPDACCDAIFLRNVYHHITAVDAFNRSLVASLKPGGRLAIIDFEDRRGGRIPKGVPANRGGHGVPPGIVVDELTTAGLTHIRTAEKWPPGEPTFLALFRK